MSDRLFETPWPVHGLAISGTKLAIVNQTNNLLIVDRQTARIQRELPLFAQDVAIHPSGDFMALGVGGGGRRPRPPRSLVAWVQLDGDMLVGALEDYRSYPNVNRVRFSPTGRWLASDDGDRLLIWDCKSQSLVCQFEDKHEITALDWLPDESGILFGTKQSTSLFSLKEQTRVATLPTGSVGDVCVCSDEHLAIGSASGARALLIVDRDLKTKSSLEQRKLIRMRTSPKGQVLYAASYDTGLWAWDLRRRRNECIYDGDTVRGLAVDQSSGKLFFGGDANEVRVWTPPVAQWR